MAKSRKYVNSLVRALEQSSVLAYAVATDKDGQKISWANDSCLSWLGCSIEDVTAQPLKYSISADSDSLDALALPPDWFQSPHVAARPFSISKKGTFQATVIPLDHAGEKATAFLVTFWTTNNETRQTELASELNNPEVLHQALAAANCQTRFSITSLVGNSQAARELVRKVNAASESNCNVVVSGPSGSGREHVARTIANASLPETEIHLIVLHGSIADPISIQETMKSLMHSSRSQPGNILLLLDVDQLGPAAQNELLGFLDLPNFSVRMLATASDEDIDAEASRLIDRLATIGINLVPLKNRKEDLPLLAQSILESGNRVKSKQMSGFSRQALEAICECDWPGNFDQLAAAIELAIEKSSGNIVEISDFPESFQHLVAAQRSVAKPKPKIKLDDYLLDIERRLVERALKQAKGNKTAAATALGISRAKLLRRLQQFNLSTEQTDASELLDPSVFLEDGAQEDSTQEDVASGDSDDQ